MVVVVIAAGEDMVVVGVVLVSLDDGRGAACLVWVEEISNFVWRYVRGEVLLRCKSGTVWSLSLVCADKG